MTKTIIKKSKKLPEETPVTSCRICSAPLRSFLPFGAMPRGNGFLSENEFAGEYLFNLEVAFCEPCAMVQLVDQPDREEMFHSTYPFFSGTSAHMAEHFKAFAQEILTQYVTTQDPFIVEIGSNDGTFLKNIAAKKYRHLGVEPSANVHQKACETGVRSQCDFFDQRVAESIVEDLGRADVCVAANVMCHIPYMESVLKGVKSLLSEKGVFIFEDPYLGDIFEKNAYDQIYDEHVFYFSLHSVSRMLRKYGLEVFDVAQQNVHGGSMRYYVAYQGTRPVSQSVEMLLQREKEKGLNRMGACLSFKHRCELSKNALVTLLNDLKAQGKRVVGYAATSKSTTVLNYCGITRDQVECIYDTTPLKQGKFSPGAHIPIRAYESFKESYPDYALLFGWNHAREIFSKEKDFVRQGGKWIVYVPRVRVAASEIDLLA